MKDLIMTKTFENNPLLQPSPQPFGVPDFTNIKIEHFKPAMFEGMRRQKRNLDAIAANPAPATFENTIIPLELAEQDLENVAYVFFMLAGTSNTPAITRIQQKMMPVFSRHGSKQAQREDIFARVNVVYNNRASLQPHQQRLVEDYYIAATHAGIGQPDHIKAELSAVSAQLSAVTTEFGERVLGQTDKTLFLIDNEADLEGLSPTQRNKAAATAKAADHDGKFGFRLMRPELEAFLTASPRRDLREKFYTQFMLRNDNGDEFDTNDLIPKAIELKQRKAALLGYNNYAQMALEHNMARNPETATALMVDLWGPAKAKYATELAERQPLAAADGINEPIQPWDWAYYTEKLRQQKYALDDTEVSKYLKLENVQAALFDVAERLFGVTMKRREDIKTHHPDAKAWEMLDADGNHVAVFIDDFFARTGKRAGAWMSKLRGSHGLAGGQRPIIYNVCNFSKAEDGQPQLISKDDAITMFHEFGHALHGMLSRAELPSQAGTNVKRDNVELPSQFMEHYFTVPEIMEKHFLHVDTGVPMPKEMIQKLKDSKLIEEGFEMTRYLISALIDLELHQRPGGAALDVKKFETEMVQKYDLPATAPQVHRLPHFQHSFSGYSAQYYVYRYANVYDYDAFAAFNEAGDPFHKPTAQLLKENIYETGNSRAPDVNYRGFRGKDATRDALLKGTGLIPA